MISGNIHTNPLKVFHAPNSGINTSASSMFAARSVRPGPTADLKEDMLRLAGGDEQRAALLEDVAKDGGKARFKELLKDLRAVADEPGGRSIRSTSIRHFTPVYAPENQLEERYNDELTRNCEYVRVGHSHPNHLQERENRDGQPIYKFRTHVRARGEQSVTKNIELSDCFYTPGKGGDDQNLAESVYRPNPQLAKRTGAYLNECPGIGKFFYKVQFDAKIRTIGTANATIFRLIPHSEGLFFIDGKNSIRRLNVERNGVEDYNQLVDRGKRFGQSGESPFTINVENYKGDHFLTIKARCDYAQFKDADNRCDIPFEGVQTPLFTATCCDEGDRQLQDTKYLYVAPLKQEGWFNVKFRITMPDFFWKSQEAGGTPEVNIYIDGQNVVNTNARVGNNNWKIGEYYRASPSWNVAQPSGYHVQFGIADASGELVVLIKDPEVRSHRSKKPLSDIPIPAQATNGYTSISGECQQNDQYPNTLNGLVDEITAQEEVD